MKKFNHWLLAIFLILPFGLGAQTFNHTNGTVNACSGNYYDPGGSGGTYANNTNQTYTICSNSGNCVRVSFTSFDLESGWDYLYIYNGPSTASPLIGTYTGGTSPGVVTSTTGCLTFRFTSDGSVTYTGWAATISCVPCGGGGGGCLPNMGNCSDVACSGNFYDNGGSGGNYTNGLNLTHTICGTPGNCVRVAFSSLQLESGFDYLYIYDGPNTGSPLIGTYSGTTSPGTITSTSGCLTFRFTTDGSVVYSGWAATISCVPCGGGPCLPNIGNCTANVCSGNFYDSGGAGGNYGLNESFTQSICSNSGNCVRVTFTSFNTEAGFDLLTIYDGPTTASPVIGTYSGGVLPGAVTSSTGCLTFRFVTDGSVVSAGWQASISCVTCPGNFNCYINPVSNGHGSPSGFTQGCDDVCSSSLIPLGFTYNICGGAYTNMYVNMNGNVTFGAPFYTFTSTGMPNNTSAVMVAPFWADVDTRSCGTVYHRANATNTIVSWHNVGYYSSQCDKLNTFQLILSNGTDPLIGVGNNTAFYYQGMAWTTGSASSGVGGFGGVPATVGINANDGINYSQIGEFDHAGAGYDGPHATPDGIDYLDNRCFTFPAGGCNILPVNYTSITATPIDGNYISVDWTTNSESNNAGFEVERSTDGVNFQMLKFVEGLGQNGDEAIDYQYADHDVRREVVYWYRLRQLDENGFALYSPVVQAMLTSAYRGHVEAAYPNPFEDEISFELDAQANGLCEISLVNSIGQVVHREVQNAYQGVQTMSISTENLASGIYTLSIKLDGRQISAQKVTK
jgi:hypothetical protein